MRGFEGKMELLISTVCKAYIPVVFFFVRISGYRFQPVDVETFHVFSWIGWIA